MFARWIIAASLVSPLVVVGASEASAQTKPCPAKSAQNYDRGTDPRAAGGQTAQNYDRGTDPRAAGGQTAQNYDRGTDPRAAGGQTAQNYNRGTDPRAAGTQTASNYTNGQPSNSDAPAGHVESTAVDPAKAGVLQTADGTGCR